MPTDDAPGLLDQVKQTLPYQLGYADGIRAGLERAAKVCDGYALQIGDKYYDTTSGKGCATAIRALGRTEEIE